MNAQNGSSTGACLGLLPTPFYERMAPFNLHQSWHGWDGYLAADEFEAFDKEYFAIRNQATLFDISPMRKYRVRGQDATRVLNRIISRDVQKILVGRVGYAVWCDEEGMVIDDGTIFHFGENNYLILCQERMYSWFLDCAWGFDVEILDETDDFCGVSLQGPTSFSVLNDAGFLGIDTMKPFQFRELENGSWISRSGYTGDLGYELFLRPENANVFWDRLMEAGRNWGVIPIGLTALNIARLEAGFLTPGAEFQSVHLTKRVGRGRTPFELGLGRLVDFDKGHFNGRRALLKHVQNGPRFNLARLDIGGKEPAHEAMIYNTKGEQVGHVTSAIWSPTAKMNIALADLKAPYGDKIVDHLWAEIYVNKEGKWQKRKESAIIVDSPFYSNTRSRKTPPDRF